MNPHTQSQFNGATGESWPIVSDIDPLPSGADPIPTSLYPYSYGNMYAAWVPQPTDERAPLTQAMHATTPQGYINASSESSTTYNPSNGSSSNLFHHGSIQRAPPSATNTTYDFSNGPHLSSTSCNSFSDTMLTYSTAVDRPYEPVFRNPDQQPLGMNQQSRVVRQLAPVFDTTSPAIPRFPGYALNQAETTSQANDISTTVFRVGLGGEVKSTDRGRNRLSTAPDSISDIAPNPTTPKKRPHLPDLGPERAETPRRRVNRLSEDRPNADLPASACALFQCWLSENPGSFPEGRQITGFQYLTDIPLEKIEAYFEKFRPRKLLEAETGPGGALPKAGTSPGLARLEADLSSAVSLACNRLRRCSATADRNRSNTRDDSRPFQCTSGCGGDFPTKDSWRKHEEINRPQNTWVCFLDDCENRPIQHRTFYTKSHFKQHFNTVHRGAKIEFEKYIKEWHAPIKDNFNRECGFCGSPFGSWRERINHIAEHFAGRISGGASDMSQWQEPWLGRRKSKPEEEPDSSSDGSGSSDGHPGDPPPPGGYSGGGPGGPTGDPSMEGGPDANQDKGQGGGRHPGRNTENRHERQFRGRRESHQQRNHTEICFNEGVEVFERKDKPPKQEIDLSYIGAWAWGGPQAGRLDLLKTRRRLDAPSQLGEGVEADNEQGFTQNATYPMLPEPGISLPSLAERLPALSAIVGTIAGVIDGQLKCSDVADVELRYRHDGTRLLWKASLVGIFPSRNSSLSSSSVEEWPGERQLKVSPVHHRTTTARWQGKADIGLCERTRRLGVGSHYRSPYPTPSPTPGPSKSRFCPQQRDHPPTPRVWSSAEPRRRRTPALWYETK